MGPFLIYKADVIVALLSTDFVGSAGSVSKVWLVRATVKIPQTIGFLFVLSHKPRAWLTSPKETTIGLKSTYSKHGTPQKNSNPVAVLPRSQCKGTPFWRRQTTRNSHQFVGVRKKRATSVDFSPHAFLSSRHRSAVAKTSSHPAGWPTGAALPPSPRSSCTWVVFWVVCVCVCWGGWGLKLGTKRHLQNGL